MSDQANPGPEMVPKARLDDALAKLERANTRVGELEQQARISAKQLAEAQKLAASSEALTGEVARLKGELKAEQAARLEDAEIAKAGLADAELVRFEHARAKRADSSTPELGKWLENLRGDPTKAPAALRDSFTSTSTEGGEGGEGGETGPEPSDRPGTTRNDPAAPPPAGNGNTRTTTGHALKDKGQRLREIPHPQGSREWKAAAAKILGRE